MDRDFFMNAGMAMPFLEPNSSVDNYAQFESSLMNSNISNDAFALRELIGKLGNAPSTAILPNIYDSRHISSPPQLHLSNMISSVPLTSVSADPGFAERAAKFSCFGSKSFNGRSAQIGMNNANRSGSPLMGNGKLPRVLSSPVLKQVGSPVEISGFSRQQMLSGHEKKMSMLLGSGANSNEESSVSEQVSKTSNEMNSRKRKAVSRGNANDDGLNSAKEVVENEDANAKRLKATENRKNEPVSKTEEEQKEGSNEKPAEPLKDYIHVRARRGQATDSHSLAERVRREKIGERMKLLQDLVPGCNKVTGKALMLDEIINYVQSLQRQVEFLSMKLATVNPELDFNTDNINHKDQKGSAVPLELYPLDSSAFYNHNHQSHQNVQQIHNANFGIQLPSLDGFSTGLQEFPAFSEDDLHSIVQMGFAQNTVNFPVSYQLSDMKAER